MCSFGVGMNLLLSFLCRYLGKLCML